MNWSNWTSYADSVLTWFIGLIPKLLSLIMENPLLGIPAILVIVGMIFRLVIKFVGSFGSNKSET